MGFFVQETSGTSTVAVKDSEWISSDPPRDQGAPEGFQRIRRSTRPERAGQHRPGAPPPTPNLVQGWNIPVNGAVNPLFTVTSMIFHRCSEMFHMRECSK